MNAPADDVAALLAQARWWHKVSQQGRPFAAKEKAEIEKVLRALRRLSETAQVALGETPGANWKGPVRQVQDQATAALKAHELAAKLAETQTPAFPGSPRGPNDAYRVYVKFLVQAYCKETGRSPAGRGRLGHFQSWVHGHGLPSPGRDLVTFWAKKLNL